MSLEQMGSDRVDVGYMQPRKLPGRARNAPAKAPPRGQKKVFLEHVGHVPDNIVPDVLPTWKKCSDNIYWNMFRANVPGHWF